MAYTDYLDTVQKVYIGYYQRAADPGGLIYWAAKLDAASGNLNEIIEAFANSAESTALYGTIDSSNIGDVVDDIYNALFGRDAEAGGKAFYVDGFTAGTFTAATIMLNVLNGATGLDLLSVNNKVTAAELFTTTIDPGLDGRDYQATYDGDADAIQGRTFLSTVGWNPITIPTQSETTEFIQTNIADSGDPIGTTPSGQTYTLTTGVDNIIGTSGNDTINGILSATGTLNAFDSLNGGAGTDTFNLSDTSASDFALPASVTYTNLENIVVSRTATGSGTGAVAITNTTFGTGVQTFSYTDASLAANMTAATVAITLNSATAVTAKATGTGTFTTVAITDTAAAALTRGSTLTTVTVTKAAGALTLTGNGITTVNLNNIGGLTTVTAASGTRAETVNTAGTSNIAGFTDATATTLNIANSGIQTLGTFTAAKATTVNYSSTAANTSMTLLAAVDTVLNVSGTKLATMAITTSNVLATINVTETAGLTLTATTSAAADYSALALIDTLGTTGILTANTLGVATAVTGGAGNDNITVGATTKAIDLGGSTAIAAVSGVSNAIAAANTVILTTGTTALGVGGSINGGTGTADVLSLVAADAVTLSTAGAVQTAFKAAVTGFETLNLAAAGGASAVDATGFGTFSTVNVTGSGNLVTISNLSSGNTINITGANAGGVTTAGTTGSGAGDILNVGLNNASGAIVAFGTITAPNVEIINIATNDTAVPAVGYLDTLTIVDTSLTTLTVAGDSGLALTFAGTALTSIDASGITKAGGFTYTSGALQYASTFKGSLLGADTINAANALAAVTITETAGTNAITGSSTIGSTLTGGTGIDTIVGGAGVDTINGGAGADIITGAAGKDVITTGAGADIVRYETVATSAAAAGAQMDGVTDFTAGTDKINFTGGSGAGVVITGLTIVAATTTAAAMAAPVANTTSLATIADLYTALGTYTTLTASTAAAGGVVAQVYTFANGALAGTYLVVNDSTVGFQAATDVVINLTGLSGTFSATDLSFTA